MTRGKGRRALDTALLAVLAASGVAATATAAEGDHESAALRRQNESVHHNLWRRFVSPDGILYDYAGLQGEVVLPTPGECRDDRPNFFGWWTPIENGGFFGGTYLVALCDRYTLDPSNLNREQVKKIVQGLYKLQDVSDTPGFIARGVADDGKSHYAASSGDQVFPWFLGLWKYLKTDIPDPAERAECVERMKRVGTAMERAKWFVVGERPGLTHGWFRGDGFCATVHLLATTRFLHDATGDPRWERLHYEYLDGASNDGTPRKETLAKGMDNLAYWSSWFNAVAQYAVRELLFAEKDPDRRALYRRCLKTNAEKAVALDLIGLYRRFDPSKPRVFTPDWRGMMPPWRPQANPDEARRLAMEQEKVWSRICPAVAEDKRTLMPSVTAAWIVTLSADPVLIREQWPEIVKSIRHFDYDKSHYAAIFFIENLLNTRAADSLRLEVFAAEGEALRDFRADLEAEIADLRKKLGKVREADATEIWPFISPFMMPTPSPRRRGVDAPYGIEFDSFTPLPGRMPNA